MEAKITAKSGTEPVTQLSQVQSNSAVSQSQTGISDSQQRQVENNDRATPQVVQPAPSLRQAQQTLSSTPEKPQRSGVSPTSPNAKKKGCQNLPFTSYSIRGRFV